MIWPANWHGEPPAPSGHACTEFLFSIRFLRQLYIAILPEDSGFVQMILFKNSVISLNYTPAADILEVGYPDLHGFLLPEIMHSIDILLDNVRNYDVKRVLLDSTRTVISVSGEESRQVALYLAAGLARTRVQKVARLQSASHAVETMAQGNIKHIGETQPLPFELKNFVSRAEAVAWLSARSA